MADAIYVIDDDLDLAQSLARLFGRHGLEAHAFADPAGLSHVRRAACRLDELFYPL